MPKKVLFAIHNLEMGGIERTVINIVTLLPKDKYQCTLLLNQKTGPLLKEVPSHVRIVEFKASTNKNPIIRKAINGIKQLVHIISNYHRYDFAAVFSTYTLNHSKSIKFFSRNSAFWFHSNYLLQSQGNVQKVRTFFQKRGIGNYNQLVFVSAESLESFKLVFPELAGKFKLCNNPVGRDIFELSKASIKETKPNLPVFISVARHDEDQKKLDRLIEAAALLKSANEKFKLILVGDGPDHQRYKDEVTKKNLDDVILFTGAKENPYPYFKISDAFVLTSDYEGYPGVLTEAFMLGIDVISTVPFKVATLSNEIIPAAKTAEDISLKMQAYIKDMSKYESKKPTIEDLDYYNQTILERLEEIINANN